jgi:hypothetical protein
VLHRPFVTALSTIAMLTLVAGCAGLGRTPSASEPAVSDPAGDLRGTWSGTIGWVGAHQYEGESRLTLQIKEDGTFTGTVTPNRGTNNLARPSTLSGTVVTNGNGHLPELGGAMAVVHTRTLRQYAVRGGDRSCVRSERAAEGRS